MLIDDEPLALLLLKNLLQEISQLEVVGTFTLAEEGLLEITKLTPDIVFLDIDMPSINGIEAARRVKTFAPRTEIVFVTAYDHFALEAFDVHASGYLLKPIQKERLQSLLSHILDRRDVLQAEVKVDRPLCAYFLGQFMLMDEEGELVKWRTKKVKELCAYLLHKNQPVDRSLILEDLWPNQPLDKAVNLLHTTVYQLRKKLKDIGYEKALQYSGASYSLELPLKKDTDPLLAALGQRKVTDVLSFTSLYTEDYLQREGYPWISAYQESLRKNYVQKLEGLLKEEKKDEKRLNILEKLYQLEPLHETSTYQFLECLIKLKHSTQARQTYEAYTDLLKEELNLSPNYATQQLMLKIATE